VGRRESSPLIGLAGERISLTALPAPDALAQPAEWLPGSRTRTGRDITADRDARSRRPTGAATAADSALILIRNDKYFRGARAYPARRSEYSRTVKQGPARAAQLEVCATQAVVVQPHPGRSRLPRARNRRHAPRYVPIGRRLHFLRKGLEPLARYRSRVLVAFRRGGQRTTPGNLTG